MKRMIYITLLLCVAAFSFGQTNATFKNLDVRGTTKMRGDIYPFGAVATSPLDPSTHELLMVDNSDFTMIRMEFYEFADSIADYIGMYWYLDSPDTIKTLYNVVVDSSFLMTNENWKLGMVGNELHSFYDDGTQSIGSISEIIDNNSTYTAIAANGDTISSLTLYKQNEYADAIAVLEATNGDKSSSVEVAEFYVAIGGADSVNVVTPYLEITADSTVIDGDLTVTGDVLYEDTFYDDAIYSGLSLAPGSAAPTLRTFKGSIKQMAFQDAVQNDEAYGQVQFSHRMKLGTDIDPHMHLSLEDAPAAGDTVVFQIEYSWADIDEAFPNTTTQTVLIPVSSWAALTHNYVDLTNLTGDGGDNVSSILAFRITRMQNSVHDTYDDWIFVLDIDFHYEIDSPGSRSETIK